MAIFDAQDIMLDVCLAERNEFHMVQHLKSKISHLIILNRIFVFSWSLDMWGVMFLVSKDANSCGELFESLFFKIVVQLM